MKQRFNNLGTILSKQEAKTVVGGDFEESSAIRRYCTTDADCPGGRHGCYTSSSCPAFGKKVCVLITYRTC